MTTSPPKQWSLHDLLAIAGDLKMDISQTSPNSLFTRVVAIETAAPDGLAVASTPEQVRTAFENAKSLVVVPLSTLALPDFEKHLKQCVGCSNPGRLWALALENFHPDGKDLKPATHRHPTAVIHDTAQIDPTAHIDAHASIGAFTQVKAGAWIGPHCVIEDHAHIGENTRLQAHVYIGPRTHIGARVFIKPSSVIGSAGFGFSHDERGSHHLIPQVGRVVIEDDVFIGALCNVDRATISETRIGQGTKIDSLAHIGHNCRIGRHTILTGRVAVAGSSTIGDHCVFGGRTTITDHVNICSHVQLAGLSGVTKDITEPGAYGGFPIQKIKEALRSSASLSHLSEMRKDIARILKHLGLKE